LSILWKIIEFLKAGMATPKGPFAYTKKTLKRRSLCGRNYRYRMIRVFAK
jgi:hypothetical protein